MIASASQSPTRTLRSTMAGRSADVHLVGGLAPPGMAAALAVGSLAPDPGAGRGWRQRVPPALLSARMWASSRCRPTMGRSAWRARSAICSALQPRARSVAELYRYRWQVEFFFKWIEQHLRIKSFFGTSENAVKTQIMDCGDGVCAGGGAQEAAGSLGQPLHNFTGVEPDPVRENACFNAVSDTDYNLSNLENPNHLKISLHVILYFRKLKRGFLVANSMTFSSRGA